MNNKPLIVAVEGNNISVILKRNSMYTRYKTNFIGLAEKRLLPKLGNPKMLIENFNVSSAPTPAPVSIEGNNNIRVTFDYSKDATGEEDDFEKVKSMAKTVASNMLEFVYSFTLAAISDLLKSSEIISLEGLSVEEMRDAVKTAFKLKRKLILVKNLQQYKTLKEGPKPQNGFNCNVDIKVLDPATNRDEYAELYLILTNSDLKKEEIEKKMSEKYGESLEKDNWILWT